MKKTYEGVYNKLKADTTLVNLLASNPPFYNPDGTPAKVNSIVPAFMMTNKALMPVLFIQEGNETAIGTKLVSESIFIRCYNSKEKSNIEIDDILDRVRVLLDGSRITITDRSLIEVSWETTLQALFDEPLGLRFKESRYRILVL